MTRITRAKAAEVAEQIHIDEDAMLEHTDEGRKTTVHSTPGFEEKQPLTEIAANSGHSRELGTVEEVETLSKSTEKGRKSAKRGAKGSKKNNDTNNNSYGVTAAVTAPSGPFQEIAPDENDAPPSPASRAASHDLMKQEAEPFSHLPAHVIRTTTPPSNAVRLTRSQLRKGPSESSETVVTEIQEPKTLLPAFELQTSSGVQLHQKQDIVPGSPDETVVSAAPDEMPNTLQASHEYSPTRLSTPTKDQQNLASSTLSGSMTRTSYDDLEAAAVEAIATPPRSNKKTEQLGNDAIAALDALEEAVEQVNAEVPDVQTSPEKKSKSKKPPPAVRTTKASQARISLAHGPKDAPKPPVLGRPRQSSAFDQPNSKRVVSGSSESSGEDSPLAKEKKEVVIPHSKPRPISMSFPTPPPPPKSTKAPTKSNFQLPGEAIAAKLKAAKEARLAKEAEDLKKKVFKARPAPTTTKPPTVRQTSTSKARESLMTGKPLGSTTASSHQRANSVATTRPSLGPRPLTSSKIVSTTTETSKPTKRLSTAPATVVSAAKRPSTAMANLNRPKSVISSRPTTATASRPPTSTAVTRPASAVFGAKANGKAGTAKGKEVFNRAAEAKSAAEREKREKEEAAKKARVDAAERSRLASREWAEKQRLRKLGLKGEGKESGSAAGAVAGPSRAAPAVNV